MKLQCGIMAVIHYLKEKKGYEFSLCLNEAMKGRIIKRLEQTNSENIDQYLTYLEEQKDELGRLVSALTINVSTFFRDTLTFEYMAEKLLPVIIKEKMDDFSDTLRVWSTGCSSGEEPYSFAIIFKELAAREGIPMNLDIFATDVDPLVLTQAQEAVYAKESVENIKLGLLQKYFVKEGDSYRLIPEIRDSVHFSLYDVIDPKTYVPPVSIFGNFDIVLCRNVMIYYKSKCQDMLFSKFYRALQKNGYLILGEAEDTATAYNAYFTRVNSCCPIMKKRQLLETAPHKARLYGERGFLV